LLAQKTGNLAEGLIFKAFRPSKPGSPQSYPQFFWMTAKGLLNQQLRPDLKNFYNLNNCQYR
jgi:hypothetical protein